MTTRSWLRPTEAVGDHPPALTVVCVPHAGAGASSFARWPAVFGPGVRTVRVQLPGREDVIAEPPLRRVQDVVAWVGPQVARLAAVGPVALYGHSVGALVVFELARSLAAAGVPPVHVAVSGRRAPHLPARGVPLHRLPDEEFLTALGAMATTPAAPLPPPRTAAWRRYALRVVRADLELGEEYVHHPAPALTVPLSAFGGTDDPVVAHDEVLAWERATTGPSVARFLPGGHFFHQDHRDDVVRALRSDWAREVPALARTTCRDQEVAHGAARTA